MISTNPYKGTKDFYPADQIIQNFIFDKWKKIAESHGFEEYQTPIIEPSEIYEAKSGDDVGKKELFSFIDLANRKLCLRPEMTPSVTRIVSAKYKELPKPIKLFSIGSFYRNERPQKGRNREFWQINADIFGDSSVNSDIEILILSLNIMKNFNAPENSYTLNINHRKLLNDFYNEIGINAEINVQITRILDKYEKLSLPVFKEELGKYINDEKILQIEKFLSLNLNEIATIFPNLKNSEGFKEILEIYGTLIHIGYAKNVMFKPSLVRGFDYYDGMVFEMFDTNPENKRSLFGGGRYNGLASIFGQKNFPAVGFAVGNETFRIFLENWNLIPETKKLINRTQIGIFGIKVSQDYKLNKNIINQVFLISNSLRNECPKIILDTLLETKSASSGLDYISNKNYDYALIIGEEELNQKTITLKKMDTGIQKTLTIPELISLIKELPNENS